MKFRDVFKTSDEPFTSPEKARLALLTSMRSRPARSEEVRDRMLRAARDGLDFWYEQTALAEMDRYMDVLEQLVPKKFPKPKPVTPPVPREENPGRYWVRAEDHIRLTQGFYDRLLVLVQARQEVRRQLGPQAGYVSEFGVPAVMDLLRDRDAAKVLMTAFVLRDACDAGYAEPMPVELAYIAVALGFEPVMEPERDRDATDRADTRRDNWGHPLKRAEKYAAARAWIPSP